MLICAVDAALMPPPPMLRVTLTPDAADADDALSLRADDARCQDIDDDDARKRCADYC